MFFFTCIIENCTFQEDHIPQSDQNKDENGSTQAPDNRVALRQIKGILYLYYEKLINLI